MSWLAPLSPRDADASDMPLPMYPSGGGSRLERHMAVGVAMLAMLAGAAFALF